MVDWSKEVLLVGVISCGDGKIFCSQSRSRPVSTGLFELHGSSVSKCDGSKRARLCCLADADADDAVDGSVELPTLTCEQHDTRVLESSDELLSPTSSAHKTSS